MNAKPAVGDVAPDFTAPVSGEEFALGGTVTFSALRGRKVVLYFYPKDDTPGCTTQACDLRDAWGELQKRAQVFGVSVDSIKRHAKFQAKRALPFPLISDESHEIVQAYGVWVEKVLYGRKYMGTERSTFVIDEGGRIAAVLEKVKPAEHVKLLRAALEG